ncbi:MAG TPA: nuclear transport factor 2 family protein [Longimicrobiaceae bacterium]|nr:nuclear transport factor 2 family protein [Longimicrobiaceae bacterium]
MKIFGLLLLLTLAIPAQSVAQTDAEREVVEVIERLFDGMRAGDGAAVSAAFHPDARLMSVSIRNGTPTLGMIEADDFAARVGEPHDEVWDERIGDITVQLDGNLATAWMRYAFHVDDTLSHCGVNALDLFRGPDGWKIIHVTDTRRTEGCVVP